MINTRWPYIDAWSNYQGLNTWEATIAKNAARDQAAPEDAIFFKNGAWVCWSQIGAGHHFRQYIAAHYPELNK